MSNLPGKTEFRLTYDDRGGVQALTGLEADARRIQNVLLGQFRADDGSYGLDLRNYLMEIGDKQTIAEIQSKAQQQINKYCPNVLIRGMMIEYIDAKVDPTGRGTNTLLFGISIGDRDSQTYDFALMINKGTNDKLLATLVL